MSFGAKRSLALAEVTLFPAFVLWFIWQGQSIARWTWIFFVVWLAGSFLIQRDTPKTLGWRADNLSAACRQAVIAFAIMSAGLIAIGLVLHAPTHIEARLISWKRLAGYAAFCLLQQVALNSSSDSLRGAAATTLLR
ncbi:MAG TPA: hypothetical protein VG322_14340 [Candidatus Acidoferrales bacterium]|jgi:hypothetical protein|nr:hypothetical protein [Candidatus Acidoferrales bacterium]